MTHETWDAAMKRTDASISRYGTELVKAYEKGDMLWYEEVSIRLGQMADFKKLLWEVEPKK